MVDEGPERTSIHHSIGLFTREPGMVARSLRQLAPVDGGRWGPSNQVGKARRTSELLNTAPACGSSYSS